MYSILLFLHSLGRWLVLISLITSIAIAARGVRKTATTTGNRKAAGPSTATTTGSSPQRHRAFTPAANAWRHWTATIAHLQLLLGMLLYFQSPIVKYTLPNDPYHLVTEHVFFRYIHITLMFVAVIVITIGSAKARRATTDPAKYRIMLAWFAAALLILFIAIPWPFSPLAGRPFIRKF
ncbi:MAG TPA: hypothetical protein VGS79_07505 [Puia sp.]|nr:hypothetical protein [Puia sp.]